MSLHPSPKYSLLEYSAVLSTNKRVYSHGGSVCLRQLHTKILIAALPMSPHTVHCRVKYISVYVFHVQCSTLIKQEYSLFPLGRIIISVLM